MSLSEVRAPIHKNRQTTMGRISGFYSTGSLFKNINLSSKIYEETQGVQTLRHFPILGPHGSWQEYSKEDILNAHFVPASVGQSFGPTWSTHWFHVVFALPTAAWNGKEIHLRFASGTEACVYDDELNVLQGISPGYREEFILTKNYDSSSPPALQYYIEMACNGMFGAGATGDGSIAPPDNNRYFTLATCDLAVFNREHFNLLIDIEQLHGMADQLNNTHIGYQAMFVANEMVTQFSEGNLAKAREMATAFFSEGPGSKAHTLHAMGHCHIDSAWLWPYDETIRKCARSFSAQLALIEEYPEYKFVCSSAQQYEWVAQRYPDLFEKIKAQVVAGRFVPVGGTWVEMDGNVPNGEAFMRQYYYGQKFFKDNFGEISKEFWLPDTFGYSAQIPQMLAHVNINRFLTQKMSWSLVNRFPNHNFWWEGIDGTKVMVHFPPGDSYNMNGTVSELLKSQNNTLDMGRANTGVFLYGWGDGGGGPTRTMIERLKRVANVDGMPKVVFSDSNTFFDELEKESSKFYKWVGELYLELHNGTYTSQGRIKWYNRKGEFLFREVELLMSMAYALGKVPQTAIDNDMGQVDACWKDFLLNQFHDVLPGSCIEYVAEDAWRIYEDLFTKLYDIRKRYEGLIIGNGAGKAIYNCLPWETKQVVFMKPDVGDAPSGENVQTVTLDSEPIDGQEEGRFRVPNTFSAALVTLRPSGFSEFVAEAPANPVSFTPAAAPNLGSFTNGILTLEVNVVNGNPVEQLFFDGDNKIPVFNDEMYNLGVSPGMLYYYDDIPLFWDAWDIMDYHLETRREPPNLVVTTPVTPIGAEGPIVGGYKWSGEFGIGSQKSTFTRYTIMRADSPMIEYYTIVDWKEDHKLLKAEFPMDILSREATFEIQYGHASRPTHMNTSWDMAKYEVCGHKWMDISQADKGVTVITDSKYGWHVRDNHVQLSLLKSPKNPDANCDIHKHYIYYAVMPHKGTFQGADVIRKAYDLNVHGSNNVPLVPTNLPQSELPVNFVTTSNPAVVVEAVKVSNPDATVKRENTICVRLYESFGGYADTDVSFNGFAVASATESNGLEEEGGEVIPVAGNKFTVRFKPFQIRSFLVKF